MKRLLGVFALATLGTADPIAHTVEVRAGAAPQPVTIGGKAQLFYELHVTNLSRRVLAIEELLVSDEAGRPLARFDRSALDRMIDGPAIDPEAKVRTELSPGARAIVFVQLPVSARAPLRLGHIFTLRGGAAPLTATTPADLPPAKELLAALADALGLEGAEHGYAGLPAE